MYAFILLNTLLNALNIIPRENKLHSTIAKCLTWHHKTRAIRWCSKRCPHWLSVPRCSARQAGSWPAASITYFITQDVRSVLTQFSEANPQVHTICKKSSHIRIWIMLYCLKATRINCYSLGFYQETNDTKQVYSRGCAIHGNPPESLYVLWICGTLKNEQHWIVIPLPWVSIPVLPPTVWPKANLLNCTEFSVFQA